MKCPNCDHLLQITERQHVEIDYCPSCRGVWLDKGELDKIIDFSNEQISLVSKRRSNDEEEEEKYNGYFGDHKKDDQHIRNNNYPNKKSKKKSFLGDLFDFD